MSKGADELTIRLARPDERLDLEALQRRASLALPDYREQLEAHPEVMELPTEQIAEGQVVVAELEGRVAGFATVIGGELDGLFVEPDLWKRGIGAALIEAAAHEARMQGLSLTVTANPTARGFYEKCGFTLEGERETMFGPALRMSR
ncbi:MAG TPA: GNAT family N-acetyltransferase [Sphingomicrobium sp.]